MIQPIPTPTGTTMDLFTAYRKMFASLTDEPVVWWYCGGVTTQRDGVGVVPHVQAETIMVYRTRSVDANGFTIDWTEVGYFRDITTGEQLDGWFNPFSQLTEPYPKSFVDGPATFTVSRAGHAVDVALVQHNAHIDGVALAASWNPASLGLVQTETKTRTFHRPDGSLPPLDSPDATQIETVLRSGARRPQSTTRPSATHRLMASTAAAHAVRAQAAPGRPPWWPARCARHAMTTRSIHRPGPGCSSAFRISSRATASHPVLTDPGGTATARHSNSARCR